MVGYCGRDCEDCEFFHASTADGGNCRGCRSDAPTSDLCTRDCTIRLCAQRNRQAICANCLAFPCERLNRLFLDNRDAKNSLYGILGLFA